MTEFALETAPRSLRVLVVDDNDDIRLLLRMTLSFGAEIDVCAEARDGREAVELWREHRPDVVIMDIGLPRLGGLQAAELIRDEDPSALIILFSATAPVDQRGAERHSSSFVAKDDLAKLPDEIRRLVSVQATLRIVQPALS